jgi:hypothetical protein
MRIWLLWSGLARAGCPATLVDPAAVASGQAVTVDDDVASHSARPGKLVETACLYSTGAMARRVLDNGARWTYQGSLKETLTDQSDAAVSCPYTTGNGDFNLVANELLDALVSCGYGATPLTLEGRSLEVDGVRYVVLTSFRVPQDSTTHPDAAPRPAP